jgi:hypothetical protein
MKSIQLNVKVKVFRYKPGVALRVREVKAPGSSGLSAL